MPGSKKRWPLVVAALVVMAVIVGVLIRARMDALLLAHARQQASALSEQLGRPVTLGNLSTQLFPSIGTVLQQIEVGPAKDEDVPLVQVARAEVSVRVWPLLRSRGKDVQVANAEVDGLAVNVVRFADGTTNVTRLQQKLERHVAPEKKEQKEEAPRDLSFVRVDRAAIKDAVIKLLDRTGGRAHELVISDVDLELKDLRAGKPLEVSLASAVFSSHQNLRASLKAAPLPKTLVPVPERLTLKSEPINLSPLAPFFPEAGFRAGTIEADFIADLGSAVPGGKGASRLKGWLKAAGLRFAEAQGGKALDVNVDTDVTADLEKGDLSLDVLEAKAGSAELRGKGKLQGFTGAHPSVQDFELVGHHLDPAELLFYYPPMRRRLAGQLAGPIELSARGAGTETSVSLIADVDLTAVRMSIPQQLRKEAGAPMRMHAVLGGAGNGRKAMRFEARADLTGADLRPGGSLNKPPGQRMEISASGTYQPAKGSAPVKVEFTQSEVHVGEQVVHATASAEIGQGKAHFSLNAQSPHLDLDSLLLGEETSPPQKSAPAPAGSKPPPSEAAGYSGMRGDMKLEVGSLRTNKMDLSKVAGHFKMVDDLVTVERLDMDGFGGQLAVGGSSVHLGPPPAQRPFVAKVKVTGVDVEQAIASQTNKKIVSGKLYADFDLRGVGVEKATVEKTLSGTAQGHLDRGTFLGLDLLSAVTKPLAALLPFASKAQVTAEKGTSLGETLPFSVTIEKGVAQLKNPISWTRPEAAMSFDGGMRLDGTLDLAGTVKLSPATVQALTKNRAIPTEPIPVVLKIGGPAWQPQVTGMDAKPAATAIAKLAAVNVAQGILGSQAQKAAEQQSQQAEQKARDEAAQSKKRLEEEAQKRLRGLFGR